MIDNVKIEGLKDLTTAEAEQISGGMWWVIAELAYEVLFAPDDVKKGYNAAKSIFKYQE